MTATRCDVVVIGAGFSGLRAALRLREQGLDVRVLEARNRVGGRAKPVTVAGLTLDAGGQWLGAQHPLLAALARDEGVRAFPQFGQGRRVLEYGGRVRRYRGTIPALPLPALIETGLTLARLDRMARTLPAHAPWTAPRAAEWDAQSLADWQAAHVRTAGARTLLDIAARAILCAEPGELSLLYFLDYVRASGGKVEYLAETRNGAQAFLFAGGMHQLAARMAAALGDRVVTDAPALRVRQDDAGVAVETARGTWQAGRLVVAVSPALAGRIDFTPALPAARTALHQGMPMGSVIKCHVAYASPFWRDAGFCGEAVSDEADFCPVFDGSPEDGRVGVLTGFFDGAAARRWSGRPAGERRAHVLACLSRWFGPQALAPIDYADQDWREEEWSAGCYTAVMPPGLMTLHGAALRAPCGRIHWAGTETAERGTGYFEGALVAGDRAATEVAAALRAGASPASAHAGGIA